MIRFGPICWSNKKKAALALSLAEAEYSGAMNAAIQMVWLRGIFTDFEIQTSTTVDLYCDNQGTIKISSDPV